jgi:hypothetical protein
MGMAVLLGSSAGEHYVTVHVPGEAKSAREKRRMMRPHSPSAPCAGAETLDAIALTLDYLTRLPASI